MAGDGAGVMRSDEALPPEDVIFGTSAFMRLVRTKLDRVACTDVPILIRGEPGTGKETLARFLHTKYPGETATFYKVKSPDGERLQENASFLQLPVAGDFHEGHPRPSAAETPAFVGTLFVDDVSELGAASRRRLMQVLNEGQPRIMPSGGCAGTSLRVICGTRHDIRRQVKEGTFPQDLYESISVVSLELPALRERREDIPGFVQYFWRVYQEECCPNGSAPSPRLVEAFMKYEWPGNIRELADTMKRYVLLGSEAKIIDELNANMCRMSMREHPSGRDVSLRSLTRQEVQELERDLILKTLRATRWNRKLAAQALNISYRALLYKIKAAGVPHKRIVCKRESGN